MRKSDMRIVISLLAVLAVTACTTIPEQIQGDFPDVSPARADGVAEGSRVRWGGVILNTKVKDSSTCFEVLSRDLDKYLRPKVEDQTAGRYIACKQGFYDPEVFTKGREITVTGTLRGVETRPVESFDYRYPVIDVDELVLWQKRRNVVVYRGFYDPWFNPYWGPYWGSYWGPWPYHPYWGIHNPGYAEFRQLLPDPAEFEPSN
jgi:outer membrane lipoprotein